MVNVILMLRGSKERRGRRQVSQSVGHAMNTMHNKKGRLIVSEGRGQTGRIKAFFRGKFRADPADLWNRPGGSDSAKKQSSATFEPFPRRGRLGFFHRGAAIFYRSRASMVWGCEKLFDCTWHLALSGCDDFIGHLFSCLAQKLMQNRKRLLFHSFLTNKQLKWSTR